MNNLKFTLKAWPAITLVTVGLCFLTKLVSGWVGIELPDQNQIEVMRLHLVHAFDSYGHFMVALLLLAQVLLIAPMLEETIFRLPLHGLRKHTKSFWIVAVALSVLFSAAHYPDFAYIKETGHFRWLPLSDAILALGFFGLAQSWLYRKTNIWCAMMNHALFNLTNLVLLFVIPE